MLSAHHGLIYRFNILLKHIMCEYNSSESHKSLSSGRPWCVDICFFVHWSTVYTLVVAAASLYPSSTQENLWLENVYDLLDNKTQFRMFTKKQKIFCIYICEWYRIFFQVRPSIIELFADSRVLLSSDTYVWFMISSSDLIGSVWKEQQYCRCGSVPCNLWSSFSRYWSLAAENAVHNETKKC